MEALSRFIPTLLIVFAIVTAMALLINYCRRRLRKTPHGLTGMCHKDGGPVCPSCQDQLKKSSACDDKRGNIAAKPLGGKGFG